MSDIQDQIGDAFAAAGDAIQGALGQSENAFYILTIDIKSY